MDMGLDGTNLVIKRSDITKPSYNKDFAYFIFLCLFTLI